MTLGRFMFLRSPIDWSFSMLHLTDLVRARVWARVRVRDLEEELSVVEVAETTASGGGGGRRRWWWSAAVVAAAVARGGVGVARAAENAVAMVAAAVVARRVGAGRVGVARAAEVAAGARREALGHAQHERAVGDEDERAGLDRGGQLVVRARELGLVTLERVVRRQLHRRAGLPTRVCAVRRVQSVRRSARGACAAWRGVLCALRACRSGAGAGPRAARTLRWILPLHFSLKNPVRISGPLVSSRMAMFLSAAVGREGQAQWVRSRGRACCYRGAPGRRAAASFTRSMVAPCAAWSPWLKFSRAVFMPASISEVIVGTSQQAGPMVQKIFVFLS